MASNIGLFITYMVSLILMIGLPIALAFFVTKKLQVSWWVILTGVLTFVASQVLRVPASYGISALFSSGSLPTPSSTWIPILNALIAGLLAGFFEETCRYIGFRILKKKARPFKSSLGLGIGHGGMEAILLGILGTGATLFTVLFYNAGAQVAKGVSTSEVSYMLAQIESFWLAQWHTGLLPGVERVIAISIQIVLSVLVWKAVRNRNALWFVLAIVYHTAVDAITVYLSQVGWDSWAIEGILAIFLLANLYMIYYFWKEETLKEEEGDEDEDDEDDEDDDEEDEDEDDEDSDENEDDVDSDELALDDEDESVTTESQDE